MSSERDCSGPGGQHKAAAVTAPLFARRKMFVVAAQRRRRWRMWLWLWMGPLWALPARAQWGGTQTTTSLEDCQRLDVAAEFVSCTATTCTFIFDAQVHCNEAHLRADKIVTTMAEGRVQRLVACGQVTFVEGKNIVDAARIELQRGIQGRLEGAVARQKSAGAPLGADGFCPVGRDALVLTGETITRDASAAMRLQHGSITLCDCGAGRTPSWRLRAPSVHVSANSRRATIFWPRLEANVLGLRMLPITPPLLPLSLPLTARAPGLLPPQLQFLGPPYPTIDLPLFVPLGPSFDLTLSPGVRSDWRGAPRLSLRFRARPSQHVWAHVLLSDTWDLHRAMAQRRRERDLSIEPLWANDPWWQSIDRQRRHLVHRVSAQARLAWRRYPHRMQMAGAETLTHIDWELDAGFISDDLVFRDLSVLPIERSMAYLPSRSLWTWRRTDGTLSIGGDYMQNLSSVALENGRIVPDFDNLRGAEHGTLHRAPAVRLIVPAKPITAWVPGLYVAGEAGLARYGPFNASRGRAPTQQSRDQGLGATQLVGGVVAEAGYARLHGPLRLRSNARLDTLFVAQAGVRALWQATPIIDGEAALLLLKRYRTLWHQVAPYVAARTLRVSRRALARLAPRAALGLDERTERRALTQVVLGVRQSMWRGGAAAPVPLLRCEAAVPFDIARGQLMQPWLRMSLDEPRIGQLTVVAALDVHRLQQRPWTLAWREFDVSYARAWGPLVGSIGYVRLAPDGDRLLRSLYDLAGPRRPADPNAPWVHTLRLGQLVSWRGQLSGSAFVFLQLPRPETALDRSMVIPRRRRAFGRVSVASVTVSAGYNSPCQCWGWDLLLSAAPQDFVNTFRFVVLVNVAGFRVGTPNKAD